MGSGIAQIAALGGYQTRLHDPIPQALDAAMVGVGEALSKGSARGRWTAEEASAASARLSAAASVTDLAGCELVIEAAPEDLDLKRGLFAALAKACGPKAVLATNTSSLPVSALVDRTPHPERVIGMHFFNPPSLMQLVEVVATPVSAPGAVEAGTEVAKRVGRTPIHAKDSPGFIANRLARPFTLEALRILGAKIADAATIDRVCRIGGGFRMGPFELIDLIGLDVNLSVARSFYSQGAEVERWHPSPIQERMVDKGQLGRKSGAGFYRYGEGPHRDPDPDLGIEAPSVDPGRLAEIDPAGPRILPRLLAQIANEAAFALEEGIGSPADMNTAMRLGFNWPLGSLELAALIGARPALTLLEHLQRSGGAAYEPAPLLRIAAGDDLLLEMVPT
jgi:3-hydroxybutyryl-CoA dehydrogenase